MKFLQNVKQIVFTSIFFIMLFSCSSKQQELPEQKQISFSWWGKAPRHEYTLQGINVFEKNYPFIKVSPDYSSWAEYDSSFEKKFTENTCADVMQINFDWLYKYSADGEGFYDLSTLSDEIELFNFTADDLAFGTMNGKLNAIPIAFNTVIPIFEKSLFDQYNLQIPSTWDELFYTAKVLRNTGTYVLGTSEKHLFFLVIAWFEQTHSKKVFRDNKNLNLSKNEIGEILDFTKQLFKENVVFLSLKSLSQKMFKNNTLAGALVWCNETEFYLNEINSTGGNCVLGNFISSQNATELGWYLKPATMYAIKKDCSDPVTAAKLLNFLLNDKEMALLQKCEKGVPSSNKSLTALMETGNLESMQYDSLMKIRFHKGIINPMLPVMEDKNIIEAFIRESLDYYGQINSREQSIENIITDFKKILHPSE